MGRSIAKGGRNELIVGIGAAAWGGAAAGQQHYASVVSVFEHLLQSLHARQGLFSDPECRFELRAVYAHASFSTEELETEALVRRALSQNPMQCCPVHTFWGGLTMHHPEDLPWTEDRPTGGAAQPWMAPNFPLFKGEFQKALKQHRVHVRQPFDAAPSMVGEFPGLENTQSGPVAWICVGAGGGVVQQLFAELLGLPQGETLEQRIQAFDPATLPLAGPAREAESEAKGWGSLPLLGRSTFLYAPPLTEERTCHLPTWPAGETAALAYLEHLFFQTDAVAHYKGATETFNAGSDFNTPINAGTRLSPYLAFGCLSVRRVIKELRRYERSSFGRSSGRVQGSRPPSVRLYQELVFRDFLRFSAARWGRDLFRLGGPFRLAHGHNPALAQFWRPPPSSSATTARLFERWQRGQTGFPCVDAGMRELALTGFLSHLHRQVCASFLVRDLRIDWRMGAEHFEACLIDHTPDANWGNWAYRILPRPELLAGLWANWGSLAAGGDAARLTTAEVVVWPLVHDSFLRHTLAWCWELRGAATYDDAREPWRGREGLRGAVALSAQGGDAVNGGTRKGGKRKESALLVDIAPYKNSGYWFCAANRANWDYEYGWFSGRASAHEGVPLPLLLDAALEHADQPPRAAADKPEGECNSPDDATWDERCKSASLDEYPMPLVAPLSVHTRMHPESKLPVEHAWGRKMGTVEPVPAVLERHMRQRAASAVEHSLK